MEKRKEHKIEPTDIELEQMEFRMIMGSSWSHLEDYTGQIFCTCGSPEKRLINYKPYLTYILDIVLKGLCSGCNTIASRYIETGEDPEKAAIAERIRQLHNKE
jgi:hypothetical protein